MSIKNVEIQDSNGNVYYPHTDADVVKYGDTTVGASLSDLTKQVNVQVATDANSLTTTGRAYFNNTCANVPLSASGTYGIIDVIAISTILIKQTLTYVRGNNIGKTYVRYCNNGTWSAWVAISTAVSPTEIAITGLNDFAIVGGGKSVYMKTQENVVKINCFLRASVAKTGNFIIFNLPAGYRPSSAVRTIGWIGSNWINANKNCIVTIGSDGAVSIGTDGTTSFVDVIFNIDFLAV